MNLIPTSLSGVYTLELDTFADDRGLFVKPFNSDMFKEYGFADTFAENFYSISKKDVIRGMHFQTPPMDHAKVVYVPHGSILDVVLDIRKGSPTYGHYHSEILSAENRKALYIPRGCAHGFLSLEDNSCTMYLQETVRSASHEGGIRADSFGMSWNISNPILSKRDSEFPSLQEFNSPFTYEDKEIKNIN